MHFKANESIEITKRSFEESFLTENFYNKQTQDQAHLKLILNYLKIDDGMNILDLGTGTGYLAFPVAAQYPKAEVTGLDIVETAFIRNRERAEKHGLKNLRFVSYQGTVFPFANEEFDIVITRYALHHFPAIHDTFHEINRVLKPNGILFLSDPAPNDDDKNRFVDSYMQMKNDGHIRFYTKKEWLAIGKSAGFECSDGFETHIRFPRKRQTAFGFDNLLKQFEKQVIEGYDLEILDDEIWITEKVNNLIFQKIVKTV